MFERTYMFKGKVSWKVVYKPRKPRYVVSVILFVVLGVISVLFWLSGNHLGAVLVFLFPVFFAASHFLDHEHSVDCEINSHSIIVNNRRYDLDEFSSFAFAEPDTFMLRSADKENVLELPVHPEDAEEIWYIFNDMYVEYGYEPSLSDVIMDILHL